MLTGISAIARNSHTNETQVGPTGRIRIMSIVKYLSGFVGVAALALASTAADAQVKIKLEPFVTDVNAPLAMVHPERQSLRRLQ